MSWLSSGSLGKAPTNDILAAHILPVESAHILESEHLFDVIRGSKHFANAEPRLDVHSNASDASCPKSTELKISEALDPNGGGKISLRPSLLKISEALDSNGGGKTSNDEKEEKIERTKTTSPCTRGASGVHSTSKFLCSNFSDCGCQQQSEAPFKFGGNLCPVAAHSSQGKEFQEEAARIRHQCMAERLEIESRGCCAPGVPVIFADKPQMNAVGSWHVDECGIAADGWQLLSMAVDSGAAETVIPHRLVSQHPIKDTHASRAGMCYSSATGEPIPNLGEQKLPLLTMENTLRGMTFQAAPVSKPLGSVKRMCASGHRVIFDDDGSYIQNKATGEINWLREESGNYMLDFWVIPPSESVGFGGPP